MMDASAKTKTIVKTEVFEGPFDLLYHLIEKNEIDIYDIPIAFITEQYIEYLGSMPERDMDSMSEFVLIAAQLLEIKSRLMLPMPKDSEEEDDPRATLVERLIEYKRFKEISEFFKTKNETAHLYFYKPRDPSVPVPEQAPPDTGEILDGVSLDALFKTFEEVLSRRELKVDKIRSGFGTVKRDLFTVEQKTVHILNLLLLKKRVTFASIFVPESSRAEMVVTFLALLELIKTRQVAAEQDGLFSEITIKLKQKHSPVPAQ